MNDPGIDGVIKEEAQDVEKPHEHEDAVEEKAKHDYLDPS